MKHQPVEKTYVRRYGVEHIPEIIAICEREIPRLPNYRNVHVSADRLSFVLNQNINNDGYFTVFVLLDELGRVVGGIGAYCVTLLFSWDRMCGDVFLFIEPKYRNLPNGVKLVKAYRDWAMARKACIIAATHTSGGNDQGMERFLGMMGFEPIGKLYHIRRK